MLYEPEPYTLCYCGSGQKYKFCCRDKKRARFNSEFQKYIHPISKFRSGNYFVDANEFERATELAFEGLALVEKKKFEQAISSLELSLSIFPLEAMTYNNLALCYYYLGDVERASDMVEFVLQYVNKQNCFSLAMQVHYYLLMARENEAIQAAKEMLQVEIIHDTHQTKQCESLARLQWHEELIKRAEEGRHRFPNFSSYFNFFQGVALANISDYNNASKFLEKSQNHKEFGGLSKKYLKLIKQKKTPQTLFCRWPYFELYQWVPQTCLENLVNKVEKEHRKTTKFIPTGFKYFIDSFFIIDKEKYHKDYMLGIIGLLKLTKSPQAIETLKKMAFETFGTDETRIKAALALLELGVVKPEKYFKIFQKGKWDEVKVSTHEIKIDLPDEIQELYEHAVESSHKGNLKLAEELNRKLIEMAPNFPKGYHNLAVLLMNRGQIEEAIKLLDKALELDKNYVSAKCSKSQLLIRDGKLDEAEEILNSIEPSQLKHPEEIAYLSAVKINLLSEKLSREKVYVLDEKKGEQLLEYLDELFECLDCVEKLSKEYKHVALIIPPELFELKKIRDKFIRYIVRRNQYIRSRPINAKSTVKESLNGYSAGEITVICKQLKIHKMKSLSKSEQLNAISQQLERQDKLTKIVEHLVEEDKNLLKTLIEHDGVMDIISFSQLSEYTEDDDIFTQRTSLTRLKSYGIVSEGVINGRESIFIPYTIRQDIRNILYQDVKS